MLDVELLTDVGRGVTGYWGRTGHYSIAALAISHLRNPELKKLMEANADVLSFDLSEIEKKGFDQSVGVLSGADKFVPLADVPDEIWKKLPKARGGRTGGRDTSGGPQRSDGPEHPAHYADIDVIYAPHGKSLRELCRDDADNFLTVAAWLKYYQDMAAGAKAQGDDDTAKQYNSKLKQGLLPFRVWQSTAQQYPERQASASAIRRPHAHRPDADHDAPEHPKPYGPRYGPRNILSAR